MPPSKTDLPPINFTALAEALADRAEALVAQWLPGGKLGSDGEYVVHSVWRSEKTASLKVRVKGKDTGRWADFGGEHRGNDLISLYGAVYGLEPGPAAVQLAREQGLERVANVVSTGPAAAAPPRPPPPVQPSARREPEREGWSVVAPVPAQAAAPTFWHYARKEAPAHVARYQRDGALYGFVVRWKTSDGGKETLPYTWCTSARDGASKWHWKVWDEPRPLYLPRGASPAGRTVVLVEGERKADVLQQLLEAHAPGVYVVASWQGGSKAWKKADWTWLAGAAVLLWPDCDGKREPLTRQEADACVDDFAREVARAAKPLLPAEKQVGMAAMLGIGALLRDSQQCAVQILPIPAPGGVTDGWDCADAIEVDGWDGARVLAFFAQAGPLPAIAPKGAGSKPAKGAETPKIDGPTVVEEGDQRPYWLQPYEDEKTGALRMSRKTVITILRNAPELRDCLGFNQLSGEVSTRVPWPWRPAGGPITDSDDLRLGEWCSDRYKAPAAPRAALTEAIHTVADARPFHPVREYLEGLTHDGKARVDKWLIHVLRIDPAALMQARRTYLMMVGRFWLIAMVARIMEPGCKFDYSLVLEGLTGRRKSTLAKVLAGAEFFSDTHFDIGGNKDGFDQLQGLWVYELSEITALRKADFEQVKAFFSSQNDRYRSSYGRYVQNHPRQCVIICTTNKRQYLYDTTGNRRFWPVWIDRPINIEWLVKYRDQLFAEAMVLWREGAVYAPTLEEEERYFAPEQDKRLVETSVQAELLHLLTRSGAPPSERGDRLLLTEHTTFVTINALTAALGTDAGKSTTLLESQIRGWLEAQGWERARGGSGTRPWGWRRPPGWPPKFEEIEELPNAEPGLPGDAVRQAQADSPEEEVDDLPF